MASISSMLLLVVAAIAQCVLCDPSPLVLELGSHQIQHQQNRLLARGPVSVDTLTFGNKALTYVDVSVGTPAQTVRLGLSMTLSDMIVLSRDANACQTTTCTTSSTYNNNASTTLDNTNTTYSQTFGGGAITSGRMISDTVKVNGQVFNDFTMLLGIGGNLTWSVLGLGYVDGEALAATNQYPNLPARMKNDGLSNVAGYSFYLDHRNSSRGGRLLLGAVDNTKFYGTLDTLPINRADTDVAWKITLASMSIFDGSVTHNISNTNNIQVLAEVGDAYMFLPIDMLNEVAQWLNATYDADNQWWISSLDQVNKFASMNLQFASTTIEIPVYDLYVDSNATHVIWALAESNGDVEFTQPLMRNAYSVVDLTHNQYSIAPFKSDYTSDNVTLISSNGAAGLVGYVEPETSGGLSTGAKAGIGVGAAVGALAVIGIIVFLVMRRRKQRKNKASTEPIVPTQQQEIKHQPSYTGGRPDSTAYGKHDDRVHSPIISTTPELPVYSDSYTPYGQDRENMTSPTMSTTGTYPAYQSATYQPYDSSRDRMSSPPPRESTISPQSAQSPLLAELGVRRKPINNQPPSELP